MMLDLNRHQFRSPIFESVVNEALQFFASSPLLMLPPQYPFQGVGVYALYLIQHDSWYKPIAKPNATKPIYVGKAVPAGWRTARIRESGKSRELYDRLRQHANSISHVRNLKLEDFRARFVILNNVESDLIGPVEASLIRQFLPLWNTTIDGFGNHDPGSGRYNQAVSEWDTLHPGRPWAKKLAGGQPSVEYLLAKIDLYCRNFSS